ncbi:hypothetical protein NDU88_011557 [Pleurodeles waltl]|uniref:Uncharacterized protein n=1 Tax=Pleurodeles waltl TaxID=8319 RepID=A0AAV7S5T5_PLEWA|nr:hypothetical protein NDU88_011557 [Pleurodeles waltl]
MPRACNMDCCRRFTALWRISQGSRPRGQAAEGATERIERCVCPRAALFLFSIECDPRCLLGIVFGVWSVLMAPKSIRTPRSLWARQNQDPGGTRKDKKHLALGLKEHSNPYAKGPQQRISDMKKDARNSVPTMFASMMRTKQMPPEKVELDLQSSVLGVNGGQVSVAAISLEVLTPICDAGGMEPASLEIISASSGNSGEVVGPPRWGEVLLQQAEDMVKHLTIRETITPALAQRGKEAKPANSDQGPFDTAESFFSLSDQSRDSALDEEIPLTDSDIEGSSVASIWASNYSTCRRKSFEQTGVRYNSGAKLRRDPPNPQEKVCEMQWDYTGTQQAFLKGDSACNTSVPPPIDGPAETPSLDLIYRTMVHNHEQAQKESRKGKLANIQLQLSIKKVVKSWQDIGTRINSMETRTEELETEVRAAT